MEDPSTQSTFDFSSPQPVMPLRRVADVCGVSLATIKRRLAEGRLPEAFMSTRNGERRHWVVADDDVPFIAKREGWTVDPTRDHIQSLSLEEARSALRQSQTQLRKARAAANTERRRADRLTKQLDEANRMVVVSEEHRRRERAGFRPVEQREPTDEPRQC